MVASVQAEISAAPGYKVEVFAAGLDMPKGLTMNDQDELFLIESGKYRILKITPDGTISVYAQSGPGAPLDFHSWYIATYPTKMAFAPNGDLYVEAVGGYYNPFNPYGDVLDTLFRIKTDGTVQSVARMSLPPYYFNDIAALAFGPDGFLYMGETWSAHDILKVDVSRGTSAQFAAGISNPTDFLFDKEGTLYACLSVGSYGKQNIYTFTPNGTRTLFTDQLPSPIAIALGPEGRLYALDGSRNTISAIDPVTKEITTFASGFHYPLDIRFDSTGALYVSEPCLGDLSSRINPTPACYGHVVKISKANQPPVAQAGSDQTVEMTSCAGAAVTLDGSGSSDPDEDGLTYTWSWANGTADGAAPDITLPYGITTVTLTVDDGKGGTASDTVVIRVADTIAPALTVAVSPNVLWPPNHKYANVLPSAEANDACSAGMNVQLVSVTSNEPDNGLGDGDTKNDIVINSDGTVSLRAERSGKGSGRIYTVTYTATDLGGNATSSAAVVTVPHNKR
jgi:sugar lactone lactonase YvrE